MVAFGARLGDQVGDDVAELGRLPAVVLGRGRVRGASPRPPQMRPPATENTRPVTSFDSGLPSHTTSGEMFSGAMLSNLSGGDVGAGVAPPRFSVMRVRATGAMALTVTP